jgi:hypothetical protein
MYKSLLLLLAAALSFTIQCMSDSRDYMVLDPTCERTERVAWAEAGVLEACMKASFKKVDNRPECLEFPGVGPKEIYIEQIKFISDTLKKCMHYIEDEKKIEKAREFYKRYQDIAAGTPLTADTSYSNLLQKLDYSPFVLMVQVVRFDQYLKENELVKEDFKAALYSNDEEKIKQALLLPMRTTAPTLCDTIAYFKTQFTKLKNLTNE